jgi:hypothetical protein
MPPEAGQSQTFSCKAKPVLPERVTQANTVILQCKMPAVKSWQEYLLVSPASETLSCVPDKKQQTPVPHPVLGYIVGEMKKNASLDAVKKIRELNESDYYEEMLRELKDHNILWQLLFSQSMLENAWKADLAAKVEANVKWACLVADARASAIGCGMWDHKPTIRSRWGVSQLIDFAPIGKDEKINFYYDIWSNIHYGYVGRAAGFTEKQLVDAAKTENLGSNSGTSEPASDTLSIQLGSALYTKGNLSVHGLLQKVYEHRGGLHRYDPTRPEKDRVFTK